VDRKTGTTDAGYSVSAARSGAGADATLGAATRRDASTFTDDGGCFDQRDPPTKLVSISVHS